MRLKKCKKCGREFSAKAEACPVCGVVSNRTIGDVLSFMTGFVKSMVQNPKRIRDAEAPPS